MKVVIVGGVAGGATAAARLRRLDENAEIILFERGEFISYANCGLPYYVGDVIKARESLLLQTPELFWERFRIQVQVKREVIAIDREKKTLAVRNLEDGTEFKESYDKLILATGSSPIRPPIPGIESKRVESIWTVPDADRLRNMIRDHGAKRAIVVGGGFIGLEMVENLHKAGLKVSLVEAQNQVMAPLDFEMAQILHENIVSNNVSLYLGDGVDAFTDTGDGVDVKLKSGLVLNADLVLLSIGVRPNSELAKACGLTLNPRGGIVVDAYLKTSDPDIYAVGDVIEVEDFIDKSRTMIPLAGPANKQGRIVADNLSGGSEQYEGTQGTSVARVFDLAAASTGANEKTLIRRGMVKGTDYEAAYLTQNSHAGYYPGAVPMNIKILFSMDGKKIFGAQVVGVDGVDKRIDTIASAIRLNAGIRNLKELELAYAPPFSSAKDPVNMAGFVAENVLTGKVRFSSWDLSAHKDAVLLDVREDVERAAFELPGAANIPLGQLRDHLSELDPNREIITFCAIGVRSYNAARILMQHGFKNVLLYPCGMRFYQTSHFIIENHEEINSPWLKAVTGGEASPSQADVSIRVDCSGLQCPGPIMKVYETIRSMKEGEIAEVSATDPGFSKDLGAWCRRTGNTLLSISKESGGCVALLRKGTGEAVPKAVSSGQGKTIIVFDGDLDKVLAAFIIANGAAAMGRPVTMFFTFWGLNALRKPEAQKIKKPLIEAMFGKMLPRGSSKLKLSKMHMGGMGTTMMKKVMAGKQIDSLETLIDKARKAGVRLVACTMSMDVMGIRPEEIIDGVEFAGVGSYLGDAEESNVNLFI